MRFSTLSILWIAFAGLASASIATAAEPIRIVALGDSVTRAVRPGVEPHQTFCAVLEASLSTPDRPVRVINSGIGGNTTADGLRRFQTDVLDHQPHYVLLMFGLNDSWVDAGKTESRLTVEEYRTNLLTMIERLTAEKANIILMTPNPALAPTYGRERNATLRPYVDAVRQLAAQWELPLVDVYQHFAELSLEREINSLFTDDMHPNPAGQQQIASLLQQQLERELESEEDPQ